MKINRYMYGSRNEGLLKEQRSRMRSPEQVAAEAYAPYKAVADVADTVGGVLEAENQKRIDEQNKDDAATATLNLTNYRNLSSNLAKQAEQENWDEERYQQEQEHLNKTLIKSSEMISDQNRSEITNSFINTVAELRPEIARNAYTIKRGKQAEEFDEQRAQAINNREWETVMFLDEMANKSGFINDAELEERNRMIDGQVTAENLMPGYRQAVANGTVNEYMAELESENLTDEALNAFSAEKAKVDLFTKKAENELRINQQIDFQKRLATINSTTDEDEVNAYIKENPHLTDGEISRLYGAMEGAEKTKQLLDAQYRDNDSKTVRDAMNEKIDLNAPPDEVFDQAIAVSVQESSSPSVLSNMLEYHSKSEEGLMLAGDKYVLYQQVAPGVSLPLNDLTQAKMDYYMDQKMAKVDSRTAAQITQEWFDKFNEKTFQAARSTWESPEYGTGKESPKESYINQLTERLTNPNTEVGKVFVAEFGEGWFNTVDKYGDRSVKKSPLMRLAIDDAGRTFWPLHMTVEGTVSSSIRSLRAQGFGGTDINAEIHNSFDENGNTRRKDSDYEIQQYPITGMGGKDERISAGTVRNMIRMSLKEMYDEGIKIMPAYEGEGTKPRTYQIHQLEVGDGVKDSKGKIWWPLTYMGQALQYTNGEPVLWTFPDKQKEETEN